MAIIRTLVRAGTVVATVAMLVPAGSAATAVAATPVPVNSVNQTVSVQATPDDEYEPQNFSDCADVLENFGYELTQTRIAACFVAAVYGNASAVTACTGGMVADGVSLAVATAACVAAVA